MKAFRMMLAGAATGALVAACSPAHAQVSSREGIALQNQIAELRQQLEQSQSGSATAPVAPSPSGAPASGGGDMTAQLLERVNALEDQNRQMRGELDQLSNQVQQQNATLSKQISDMNFAMQSGQGGAAAAGAGAAAAGTADTPPAPQATPQAPAARPAQAADPLQAGRAALAQRDYPTAERDARAALAAAKSVPAKMDAQYLIAQSLAGQKQYRQSAVAYYDAYTRSPRAPKAQDSLLGVAATMLALGDKGSACQALAKLHTEFPNPQPRVKAASQAFTARAACH